MLLAIGTEFGQLMFSASRSFEIWDIVANIIGSFSGLIIFRTLKQFI
jgi:glycopeptide antibiotics resistance protein